MNRHAKAFLFLIAIVFLAVIGTMIALNDHSNALAKYKKIKDQPNIAQTNSEQQSSIPQKEQQSSTPQNEQQEESSEETQDQAHFIFTAPENNIAITTQIKEGQTVFDVLQKIKEEGKITMTETRSDMGVFIEELNGVHNNTQEQTYWFLYKNGESANVGASALTVHPNDTIEWRYHKAQ